MTATIFAGGHRFYQSVIRANADRWAHVWTCERCGIRISPSEPFTECKAERS